MSAIIGGIYATFWHLLPMCRQLWVLRTMCALATCSVLVSASFRPPSVSYHYGYGSGVDEEENIVAFPVQSEHIELEPEFSEPIKNVTVPAGRKAILSCVVEDLGNYRVAWLYVDRYTLLTLSKNVITHNSRFKVTHNGHRTWHLIIDEVQEKDTGAYMCQINTSPMKYQTGYLTVVVAPRIDDVETSSDTEVREGANASLRCAAHGTPEPTITWRREDNMPIQLNQSISVASVYGNWLHLTKVSRLHMSAYLCIAANGVLPAVSKRILLEVSFAPMIWIPNQLVGASIGSDVTLDCHLEAHPKSLTYWTRSPDAVIQKNEKFDISITGRSLYKAQLRLTIRYLEADDFGEYHCVAKNTLGETEGTIKLYEVPVAAVPAVSSSAVLSTTDRKNGTQSSRGHSSKFGGANLSPQFIGMLFISFGIWMHRCS